MRIYFFEYFWKLIEIIFYVFITNCNTGSFTFSDNRIVRLQLCLRKNGFIPSVLGILFLNFGFLRSSDSKNDTVTRVILKDVSRKSHLLWVHLPIFLFSFNKWFPSRGNSFRLSRLRWMVYLDKLNFLVTCYLFSYVIFTREKSF